ncbi:hypothetical protein [Actinospica robiniae]|uniref:hypothetical protein n=1 Tax=Actinospica robiniae TaxID=304901 RepID=UPI00040A6E4F|nr:hypothetical protein [Actinospica robiniae]
MRATRQNGNYTILEYQESDTTVRFVVSYVLESAVCSDVYSGLIGGSMPALPTDPAGSFEIADRRPTDRVEFTARNRDDASSSSSITMSLAPTVHHTVLAVTHRAIPVAEAEEWRRFWGGPAIITMGAELAHRSTRSAPMLIEN